MSHIMYSTNNKERRYVQGYGFLSFAKRFGKRVGKKAGDSLVKTAIDSGKTISKRALSKASEARGDFIGQKIADKITSKANKISDVSDNVPETDEPYEVQLTPQQRQSIINELRLISEV